MSPEMFTTGADESPRCPSIKLTDCPIQCITHITNRLHPQTTQPKPIKMKVVSAIVKFQFFNINILNNDNFLINLFIRFKFIRFHYNYHYLLAVN